MLRVTRYELLIKILQYIDVEGGPSSVVQDTLEGLEQISYDAVETAIDSMVCSLVRQADWCVLGPV